MRTWSLCTILAGACALAGVACQPSSPSRPFAQSEVSDVAYVRLPAHFLTKDFLDATGFNRDHVRDDVFAFGYLQRDKLESLPLDVFREVVELDAKAWSHHSFDPKSLELRSEAEADTLDFFEDYHYYDALTAELQRIAEAHPDVARLESIGKSAQNRELWVLKLSDSVETDEDEPNLLYIANMHGDEVVGRELMIYLARQLADGYGTDQRATKLLQGAQVWIMPSMNPDGFELGQRYNARGVDLNRDFPDFSSDPTDTPAGRAPETAAVMAFHQRHHFEMALNYHGGEVIFNVPWDTKANGNAQQRFGDDALMQLAGHAYADQNPAMRTNSGGSFERGVTYGYEWYEVDGGMQDWSVYYRNAIHATVELSHTKWPNASQLAGMWNENKEAMLKYLEQGLFGVHLKIVGEGGQVVPSATVRVASLARDVQYPSGYVHRPAMAGAQTVRISAPGLQTKEIQATPWVFDGVNYQTVALSR